MTDKSVVGVRVRPKGREYCDVPGTSCTYDENNICVHCGRPKGWRRGGDTMLKRKDRQREVTRLEAENMRAMELAAGEAEILQAMIFVRLGEVLQQLQEIQANSWLR